MGVVNNSKGSLPEIAKRISSVASDIITVRTATVFTDSAPPAQTEVVLDNDPSQTPINALGLNFAQPKGTRVVCLAYPPRGLVVLGAIADSSGGSVSEITLLCDVGDLEMIIDCDSIQTLAASVASTLHLNPEGGNILLFDDTPGGVIPELQVYGSAATGDLYTALNYNQLRAGNGVATSILYFNYGGGGVNMMGAGGADPLDVGAGIRIYNAGNSARIDSITANTYLHINWFNSRPVAIGSGGTGRLGGPTWQVDGALVVVGTTTTGYPTAGNANASLTAGGLIQRIASSRRYKKDISGLDVPIETILSLEPRKFKWKHRFEVIDGEVVELDRDTAPWDTGFIAEEADELGLDFWVEKNEDGTPEGFHYSNFVAAHQLVLRNHQTRIAELEAKNETLEARLAKLEKIVAKLPPGLTK